MKEAMNDVTALEGDKGRSIGFQRVEEIKEHGQCIKQNIRKRGEKDRRRVRLAQDAGKLLTEQLHKTRAHSAAGSG